MIDATTTDVAQHIAEIRARWARKRVEIEAKEAQEAAAVAARLRRELLERMGRHLPLLERMGRHLPAWMLEYVQDDTDINQYMGTESVCVLLPGCAPFHVRCDMARETVLAFEVRQPMRVQEDDASGEWYVNTMREIVEDLDAAVGLAASYGESWWAMKTDADRRNAEGRKPPPPEPTALQAAQEALIAARLNAGLPSVDALVAIAEQLALLNDNLAKLGR